MLRPPTRATRHGVHSLLVASAAGFGFLELLVVVAIIAILAAIALPHYHAMRSQSLDAKVESAVRQVATGEEAYYAGHQRYTTSVHDLDGMVLDDVAVTIESGTSGDLATSFRVHATVDGAAHSYAWLSDPLPGAPHLTEE